MSLSPELNAVLLDLDSDVKRLDYVNRYSSIPVLHKETVSQHSYWVILYATLIHQSVSNDEDILRYVMLKSLTHDIMECLTGDVVKTFKYSSISLKKTIDKAEKKLENKLSESIRQMMGSAVSGKSHIDEYVKDVVKAADFMSLYHFMTRELNMGNREIIPFYKQMIYDLQIMANITSKHNHDSIIDSEESCSFPKVFYHELVNMAENSLEKIDGSL